MRLAIVYPRANLDTVPSLIGAAEQLAEAGHEVDVLTYRQAGQPDPAFAAPNIRLRSLGVEGLADLSTAGLRGAVKRVGWLPSVARAPLVRTYNVLGAGLAGGSRLAARARGAVAERETPYGCVIGVDPDGLRLAHEVSRGAPLGYYSLELLLSYELSTPSERQLKAHERALSRQAAFVIVQDEQRGRLLAEDNALDWSRVVLVPNAPAGPARRRPDRYWHARFDLPESARVVVHSGSLGDWTGIEAIVDSVANWPDGWVLVIHTRFDAESSAYVEGLRARADARRVYFSLKPVPRQEYDPLIDGADVGLAFYVTQGGSAFTQRNVQTIGLSSGKLAYYLRAGLPVIVNRASSIAEVVERDDLGVAVDGAPGIAAALQQVADAYDRYSAGALSFFDQHLDFTRAFGEVVRRVDALR
ncbi:MAG TPA: glycosyltransferase [Chloroflexota bacterium]|jgi:glycosyltransferase involved in cell wall biosynthesis